MTSPQEPAAKVNFLAGPLIGHHGTTPIYNHLTDEQGRTWRYQGLAQPQEMGPGDMIVNGLRYSL